MDNFLSEFWQKKPVLLRGVFPKDFCPLTPADLEQLSGLEEADSRLIVTETFPPDLYFGPFGPEEFEELPDSEWTLLVQEVDRLDPSVARIQDCFRFVPNWRLDDLMISYATPGGGVGAHTDQYDVFLIQGMGRRRWQIGLSPNPNPQWKEGSEVAILAEFTPEAEWVVEPGDVLYLPPHFAHNGIAIDPCLTLSVGFRAPAAVELLEAVLEYLVDDSAQPERFVDRRPDAVPDPGLLDPEFLATMRGRVRDLLADDGKLNDWIARSLTEPMRGHVSAPETGSAGGGGRRIRPVSAAQIAYAMEGDRARLFVAGERYDLPASCSEALRELTGPSGLPAGANMHPDLASVITELLEEGLLRAV